MIRVGILVTCVFSDAHVLKERLARSGEGVVPVLVRFLRQRRARKILAISTVIRVSFVQVVMALILVLVILSAVPVTLREVLGRLMIYWSHFFWIRLTVSVPQGIFLLHDWLLLVWGISLAVVFLP